MIAWDDVHISGCEGIMSWWGNDLFPDLVYVDMFVHYAFNYWGVSNQIEKQSS